MADDDKRAALIARINEGLEKKKMKPKPAALAMGLSETAILDILKGRSQNPKRNTLQTMADFFDMPLDYLMGGAPIIPELLEELKGMNEERQRTFAAMIGALKEQK